MCNHPDLFEGRAIIAPFDMQPIPLCAPSCVPTALHPAPLAPGRDWCSLKALELVPAAYESMTKWQVLCIEVGVWVWGGRWGGILGCVFGCVYWGV